VFSQRRRTKKLIVALQFQFANQAAWGCDDCRRRGLEEQRRCGWQRHSHDNARAVWARANTVATQCPRSLISADSLAYIEEFFTWKLFGGMDHYALAAKTVDAFFVLEREWLKEKRNGHD
jgi:hypothetical protein